MVDALAPRNRDEMEPQLDKRAKKRSAVALRAWRTAVASELGDLHGGVVHRRDLRAEGVTRFDIRTEVIAGRWHTARRHTIVLNSSAPSGQGRWWWALWESGYGAMLHGISALVADGMTGFDELSTHVALPRAATTRRLDGVLCHRQRILDPGSGAGVPRARPEWATIRGAQWAASDRQAALLLCLPVQQRLTTPARLAAAWATVGRSPRHAFLDRIIADVCDGAHSLGELDFALLCRRRGLPEPRRQVVRTTRDRRAYLDVEFDGGAVVEIDGSHHWQGLSQVDDALRANELTLAADRVLRIPLLGLRLQPDRFMDQVARLVLGQGPWVRAS